MYLFFPHSFRLSLSLSVSVCLFFSLYVCSSISALSPPSPLGENPVLAVTLEVETLGSSTFSFSDLRPVVCDRNPEMPEFSPELESAASMNGRDDFDGSPSSESCCDLASPSAVAAVKLQKVYRSYRTRRRLADTAVVVEEFWWQALDFVRLNHSTISFFGLPETAASRWNRVRLNASKVGKGLSQDSKAQKLAFEHWIEAIDPRHRYGHSLHKYYEVWCEANSGQPFFYWLDVGDGKDLELKECPRSKLRQQCIKYLGPQEREHYEYNIVKGKITHKLTGDLLDTKKASEGIKWIFVMSTCKQLYIGEKKKGKFHHSSFLAGGATLAAGRLTVEHGILKSISAYSGHYRPTDDRLESFLSFLKENGVNLDEVQIQKSSEGYEDNKLSRRLTIATEVPLDSETPNLDAPFKGEETVSDVPAQAEPRSEYRRTLSGGLQSPRPEVPKEVILQRINSKKADTYELGHQLSRTWSTGAGPRIGCVADYPLQLRSQALEFTALSPRNQTTSFLTGGFVSPRPPVSPSP